MFKKPHADFKEVSRLTVLSGKMQKKTVVKSKFSQINDKRFHFPDGILSPPFHHPNFQELSEFKQKMVEGLKNISGKKKKGCQKLKKEH